MQPNRRLRKQTTAREDLCSDLISLLSLLGIAILFKIQNKYFLDKLGKADAMSNAMVPA